MHSIAGTCADHHAEFGLLTELHVMKVAQASVSALFLPDDRARALMDHADLLWRRVAQSPVTSRYDAAAKLELIIFDYDEGREPVDQSIAMLRQVERWLRDPFVWSFELEQQRSRRTAAAKTQTRRAVISAAA